MELLYKKPTYYKDIIAAIAVVILLVWLFLLQNTILCDIDGPSMQPTLYTGDNVVCADRKQYHRNDIIVFDRPDKQTVVIKRVIAIGGDTIRFEPKGALQASKDIEVELYIKYKGQDSFVLLQEPYLKEKMRVNVYSLDNFRAAELGQDIKIPEGSYFAMGDNRNDSTDCRFFGAIDTQSIYGKRIAYAKKGSFFQAVLNIIYPDFEALRKSLEI